MSCPRALNYARTISHRPSVKALTIYYNELTAQWTILAHLNPSWFTQEGAISATGAILGVHTLPDKIGLVLRNSLFHEFMEFVKSNLHRLIKTENGHFFPCTLWCI